MKRKNATVGTMVTVKDASKVHPGAWGANAADRSGQTGKIVSVDQSACPIRVEFDGAVATWFYPWQLRLADPAPVEQAADAPADSAAEGTYWRSINVAPSLIGRALNGKPQAVDTKSPGDQWARFPVPLNYFLNPLHWQPYTGPLPGEWIERLNNDCAPDHPAGCKVQVGRISDGWMEDAVTGMFIGWTHCLGTGWQPCAPPADSAPAEPAPVQDAVEDCPIWKWGAVGLRNDPDDFVTEVTYAKLRQWANQWGVDRRLLREERQRAETAEARVAKLQDLADSRLRVIDFLRKVISDAARDAEAGGDYQRPRHEATPPAPEPAVCADCEGKAIPAGSFPCPGCGAEPAVSDVVYHYECGDLRIDGPTAAHISYHTDGSITIKARDFESLPSITHEDYLRSIMGGQHG